MSKLYKELLKRIDERTYLTEREHQEYLKVLNERLDKYDSLYESLETLSTDAHLEFKRAELYKTKLNEFLNCKTEEEILEVFRRMKETEDLTNCLEALKLVSTIGIEKILCPECGSDKIVKLSLLSDPPKNQYNCIDCGCSFNK